MPQHVAQAFGYDLKDLSCEATLQAIGDVALDLDPDAVKASQPLDLNAPAHRFRHTGWTRS